MAAAVPAAGRVLGVWRPRGYGPLRSMLDPLAEAGKRISNMTLLETGEAIQPDQTYVVAG